MSTQPVSAGGPSTINGVLYQLLYSLITLGQYKVENSELKDGKLQSVTIVIEPADGGDQQVLTSEKRIVTQIKARSSGGTWSLKDIICDVLPDLYRAVRISDQQSQYQFVTEGKLGRWGDVYKFFGKIEDFADKTDCLSSLDNQEVIYSPNKNQADAQQGQDRAIRFWDHESYTRRTLFEKIVLTLRDRKSVASEPFEETCIKTRLLLRSFRIIEEQTHEALRKQLDEWLIDYVASEECLSEKRDHLLLELGRKACRADSEIEMNRFFQEHGLSDSRLTDWVSLSKKASDYLDGVLYRKRMRKVEDVRKELTDSILTGWTNEKPIVLISGESGCGKTWHGYRSLIDSAKTGDIAILVDSHGKFDEDMDEISRTFWHTIVGNDECGQIQRLRARLRRIDPNNQNRRLTILVDNVACRDEMKRLIEENWEEYGIRIAITCDTQIVQYAESLIQNRGRVIKVNDYTISELQTYLSGIVGIDWCDVPYEVQKTIQRPILAKIFGDLVSGTVWHPRNEYEIIEKSWVEIRNRGANSFDIDGLRTAALKLLSDVSSYPWDPSTLRECNIDTHAVERLKNCGWIRETSQNDFEVWHNRLLDIAPPIVESFGGGDLKPTLP